MACITQYYFPPNNVHILGGRPMCIGYDISKRAGPVWVYRNALKNREKLERVIQALETLD